MNPEQIAAIERLGLANITLDNLGVKVVLPDVCVTVNGRPLAKGEIADIRFGPDGPVAVLQIVRRGVLGRMVQNGDAMFENIGHQIYPVTTEPQPVKDCPRNLGQEWS